MAQFGPSFSVSYPDGCNKVRVTDTSNYGSDTGVYSSSFQQRLITVRDYITGNTIGTQTLSSNQFSADINISALNLVLIVGIDLINGDFGIGSYGYEKSVTNTCLFGGDLVTEEKEGRKLTKHSRK